MRGTIRLIERPHFLRVRRAIGFAVRDCFLKMRGTIRLSSCALTLLKHRTVRRIERTAFLSVRSIVSTAPRRILFSVSSVPRLPDRASPVWMSRPPFSALSVYLFSCHGLQEAT
jgi:hypothetical protein